MRRFKKILIGLILLFVVYTLVGFFVLPPILKSILLQKLSENLHRETSIEKIRVNPYILSVTVQGFKVKDRKSSETFAACDEIFLNLQSISALKLELILKEIRIRQPYLRLVRNADGSYNFSDLLEKKKTPDKDKDKGKGFLFSLNNIQIQNGKIDFLDQEVQKEHTVRDLMFSIPTISNTPQRVEIFTEPALSAKINGTPYEFRGKTKPFSDSLETVFNVEFEDLNVPFYLAYIPLKMNFQVPSAFLDAKSQLSYVRPKDKPPTVVIKGNVALKKLVIDDGKGKPLFRLPRFSIDIASLEPIAKKAHLAKVAIESPELEVRRNPDGAFNVESLIPSTGEKRKETAVKEDSKPFAIEIDEIALTGGKLTFSDLAQKQPFKSILSPIEVKIARFSNGKDQKTDYTASLETEAKEKMKVEGNLSLEPMQGEGSLEIKGLPLRKYSPYYQDRILFDIADGRMDLATHYQYAIREKEVPFSLQGLALSLQSLRLKQRGVQEDFLKVPLLNIRDTQFDLSKKELRIGSVSTAKGNFEITRRKDGTFDILDLLPAVPKGKEEKTAQDQPWLVTLRNFSLDQYAVKMKDFTTPTPVTLGGEKIRVTAENLSTGKGQKGKVSLSLLFDQRTSVSSRATLSIDPLQADGSLEIKRLPFQPYSPYYKEKILFEIEDGELELQTQYHYSKGEKGLEIRLAELSSSLIRVKLRKKEERDPFLSIPAFSLKGASLNLNRKEVSVREVSSQNGSLHMQRLKDGQIDLLALVPTSKTAAAPESKTPRENEKSWAFRLGRMAITQYQFKMEDNTPSQPITLALQDIEIKGENLTTARDQKGNASLAFRLNQRGKVALNGSVGINPITADLQATLAGIALKPLQSYFTDRVKIVIGDGDFAASGNLKVKSQEGSGWQVTYKGESSINHFASVDKLNTEDFLKWDTLSLSGLNVGYNPLYVHIDEINLINFYSRLIIHSNGSLNVQNILGKDTPSTKATAPPDPKKEPPPEKPAGATPASSSQDIKIGRIILKGGQINFSDQYIQPNYSANLTEITGKVSNINASDMRSGDAELRALWDKIAPLEIVGKINPVAQNLFVDLHVKMNDIDLSPMGPYSGKYVGYTIHKGKLSMDLKYLLEQKKLDAQNKIFFDQLTFGERVESPQATKLPVRLAISLLKDRKGEIHLDIPVTGSLDDPKFSVFRIILQVIGNLLAKAATSPFALLSAMFGGAEQLEYTEFEYGSAEVKGETVKKLNTVAKVLQDRPGVRLDIQGHVDMEKDRESLKKLIFQRKLKAQKLKETAKKGQSLVPVDEIKIEAAEYARYLKKAYREEKFPKPKNFIGLQKNIPDPEMEKLMFTHIEVKENDLRELAFQRSKKVKDFLVREGKIEPERIFLVEAKTLAPEKKEKIKESRVVFTLK